MPIIFLWKSNPQYLQVIKLPCCTFWYLPSRRGACSWEDKSNFLKKEWILWRIISVLEKDQPCCLIECDEKNVFVHPASSPSTSWILLSLTPRPMIHFCFVCVCVCVREREREIRWCMQMITLGGNMLNNCFRH